MAHLRAIEDNAPLRAKRWCGRHHVQCCGGFDGDLVE
jgi:hypothetical protein